MDERLLGELAKAYNNNQEFEAAMSILDSITEENRDAVWYYRYGYAHMRLSEDLRCDYETESKNALAMIDKTVELAQDREIIEWCIERVSLSSLKKVLEEHDEKYPFIHQYYLEYADKNIDEFMQSQKREKYKKIRVEDIKNAEDYWEIIDMILSKMIQFDIVYMLKSAQNKGF